MGARVLDVGMTPAQVVADLASKGHKVSERSLRAKARELGACRIFGKAMILLPEHVDLIFGAPKCQTESQEGSKPTYVERLGGSGGALKARTDTTARALELMMSRSRKPKSGRSKTRRENVLSLDEMRQSRKNG